MGSSQRLYTFAAPKKDVDLAPIEQFDRLEAFEANGDGITDTDLAHIEGLTGLLDLKIHDAPITDAGLAHLKRLTRLRKLEFRAAKDRAGFDPRAVKKSGSG